MAWENLFKLKRVLGDFDLASESVYDVKSKTNGVEVLDPRVFVSFSNYDFSSGYTNIYSSYNFEGDPSEQKIKVHCDVSKTVIINFTGSSDESYTFNNIFYYEARVDFIGFSDHAGGLNINVEVQENGVDVGNMARTSFWQIPVSGVGIRTEASFIIRRNFSTPQSFTTRLVLQSSGFWDAGLLNMHGGYSIGKKIDRGGKCNLLVFNGENAK